MTIMVFQEVLTETQNELVEVKRQLDSVLVDQTEKERSSTCILEQFETEVRGAQQRYVQEQEKKIQNGRFLPIFR